MNQLPAIISTADGTDIYHLGPGKEAGALPTLLYLSIGGDESLQLDPFNQPVAALAGKPMRILSLHLPGHGPGYEKNHAVHWMAQEVREGRDPFTPFFDKTARALDELIKSGWIDPAKLAVAGLSRGAFFAMHIAARVSEISAILGFAPMTFLSYQRDFADLQEHPLVKALSPLLLTDKIFDRAFRFYIGNRDIAVGTERCFILLQALTAKAYDNHKRSPEIEMIMSPSIGHRGHGTTPKIFFDGANWIKEKLLS